MFCLGQRTERGLLLVAVGAVLGCGAHVSRVEKAAINLRQELLRRAPDAPPNDLVVPFEVSEPYVGMARDVAFFGRTPREQAEKLIRSLTNENVFGIAYSDWETLSATAALEVKRGNCFAFASVLVGLARSLNLHAVYAEFSPELEDVHRLGSLLVREGHITAMIPIGQGGYTAIEFGTPVRYGRWRIITDLEATAHYYNNRGVEPLLAAREAGLPVLWEEAVDDLRIATQIVPEFYRAWNNLGVVTSRLGRREEAAGYFRKAIEHGDGSSAAHANLGALLLDLGRPREAAPFLLRASELDDENARVLHLLGAARYKTGRPDLAIIALERALDVDENHAAARRLLTTITKKRAERRSSDRP